MSRTRWAAVLVLVAAACGSEAPRCSTGPNSVCGSVNGNAWNQVAAAYWIGMPSAGSAPVIVFLTEVPLRCQDISVVNWDKVIGNAQVLEIGLSAEATRAFQVPAEASESYLRGELNPEADSGLVTITAIQPAQNIVGSFQARYRTDQIQGTFDATYCASGVEP